MEKSHPIYLPIQSRETTPSASALFVRLLVGRILPHLPGAPFDRAPRVTE